MAGASHSRNLTSEESDCGTSLPIESSRRSKAKRWPKGRKGFSPDGRIFALSEPDQIKLWDSEIGEAAQVAPIGKSRLRLHSHPMGGFSRLPATRTGEAAPSVTLWRTSTLTEAAKLPGAAIELTFSPNGQTLAVIHSDSVSLWDIDSQSVHATLQALEPEPATTRTSGAPPASRPTVSYLRFSIICMCKSGTRRPGSW